MKRVEVRAIMKINELFGTKYPFIQGGMANIATGEFAAAVSNAGGLGLIGAGGMNADLLRENIRKCKSLTNNIFGVNLMLMNPEVDKMAEVVVEEGVKVITTGAGNPGKYIKTWKEHDMIIIPVVASVALARKMEASGVDAVIAEGTESGGHVGEMTTMTLVPQVVDAVNIPVIAAGGIADGRQLTAAFALGASGAQVGTCLLVSEECPIHEAYKAAIIKAKDNGTVVTGRITGAPVRCIKNQMTREYLKKEKEGAELMELEKYTLGSLRRAVFDGDTVTGSLMAGQVSGQLKEIKPIAQIFEDMYTQYEKVAKSLA
jgi:enoyl-[acyl-carrier protein] reductase II